MRQLCDLKMNDFCPCDDITDILPSFSLLDDGRLLDVRLYIYSLGESDLHWLIILGLA